MMKRGPQNKTKISECPNLMADWDVEKNSAEGLDPSRIVVGSKRRVHWKCHVCGHEWQANPANRTRGQRCPACVGKALVVGKNDLASVVPGIAKEWHPSKNEGLLPNNVFAFSHKKCWWLCPQGHEYLAIVEHRARGSTCPYCSNHKILSGFNDLATHRPDIVKEWCWEKNGSVSPSEIARLSSYNAWWRCALGHEYQMKVAVKVSGEYGCPICSGKRVLSGYNDLQSQRPEIAAQWNYARNNDLKPVDITVGSNKKVWWLCEKGHSWKSAVHNRTNQNQGCPYCAGKKVWPGFNDFATYHPELLKYWDTERNGAITPQSVTYGTSVSVWWKCDRGHSYDMPVVEKHHGYGCPICSVARLTSENNFATLHPDLLSEWDFQRNLIKPTSISSYSKNKVWWKCPRGHLYSMAPSDRVFGHGCPTCNLTRRTSFFEEALAFYLKTQFEIEQRAKVAGKEIDLYIPSLKIGIEYDGMYYHSGDAAIARERRKNEALKAAGIRLIRVKETKDIESVEDDIIYHKAGNKFDGIPFALKCISEILARVSGQAVLFDVDVVRDKGSIIKQYEVDRDKNSLVTLFPKVAAKWNYERNGGALPGMFTPKSGHSVWWKCPTCGNEWYGPIEHQTNGMCADNARCPKCIRAPKGMDTSKGYTLLEQYPSLSLEWNFERNGSLTPKDVTPGSKKVVWWRCSFCGAEWMSSVKTRTIHGSCGCRRCKLKYKRELNK